MKLLLALALLASPVLAAAASRCQEDLIAFDSIVAGMRADFGKWPADTHDKEWVKKKLSHMVEVDQYMRKQGDLPRLHDYDEADRSLFTKEFDRRFKEIDLANTRNLRELLELYPWFTISQFGARADSEAWLLVQHADENPEFQKQVLGTLTALIKTGETNPRNYAYLFDRVAASFKNPSGRLPQRYGTQGSCVGPGRWEPLPIEDPDRVDKRRAAVGLGPLADYIAGFKDICH